MGSESADDHSRVSGVIREVNRVLVDERTRDDIETGVCETLANSDPYLFAWIGEYDDGTDLVVPRAHAGVAPDYLSDISIRVHEEPARSGPTATAIRTGEIQTMQNIREDSAYEPWRDAALERGFESSAAIPIRNDETSHGVLNVYADRPFAFEDAERRLLTELGQTVGTAIAGVEARQELQTSRRKYKQLTERLSDAYYAVDSEWEITYWNDQMAARTGKSARDVEGTVLWDAFPELLGTENERQYREAMETQEQRSFETYLDDPYDYWLEIDVYPDEDGLSIFSREITDRKEREQELKETKDTLEAIIEASPDAIAMVDTDGVVTMWNRAAEDVFGWKRDEILGEAAPFVPEDKQDEFETFLERLDAGETLRTVETVRRTKSGQRLDVSLSSTRVESGGELVGYLGTFQDISTRKEYEQRLEEQRDNLEVLNQMVRHDIRNNLQVILTYAGLLEDYVDEDAEEYVQTVASNAESAVALTKTARDLAEAMMRSESGLEPVSLRSTLGQQLDDVRAASKDAVITITDPIPAVDVLADDMLDSVFRNVLNNALTHNDKQVPHLTVAVEDESDTVLVSVADNGPGVPDEQKTDIFGRGEKGIESEGTGIGLYLVETLLDQYGGDVWVTDRAESETAAAADIPGDEGAVFNIRLDRA